MTTILIVLAFAAVAVGVVWWATRRKAGAPAPNAPGESDTAWNDPVTPTTTTPRPPRDDTASKI
jgi:hypothetical protein